MYATDFVPISVLTFERARLIDSIFDFLAAWHTLNNERDLLYVRAWHRRYRACFDFDIWESSASSSWQAASYLGFAFFQLYFNDVLVLLFCFLACSPLGIFLHSAIDFYFFLCFSTPIGKISLHTQALSFVTGFFKPKSDFWFFSGFSSLDGVTYGFRIFQVFCCQRLPNRFDLLRASTVLIWILAVFF